MRRNESCLARFLTVVAMTLLCIAVWAPVAAHADEMWLEDTNQEHHWKRVWGETSYDTMEAVVNVQDHAVFPDGGVDTVIVATGHGYWDALSAAGLAGVKGAAILITPADYLHPATLAELKRMKPHHVYIAGGKLAVSEQVEADIVANVGEGVVERVSGPTATATAEALFKAGSETEWNKGNKHDYCIVATANGYWDALSIAPLAYAYHIPIFLTQKSSNTSKRILTKSTLETMKLGDFDHFIIVGGPIAVSEQVVDQLKGIEHEGKPITVERWYGQTAVDTSAKIARKEIDEFHMSIGNMMVATSYSYQDALTAAPVAGRLNSVLVLMDRMGNRPQAFDAVFDANEVGVGYVIGGPFALSEAASSYIYLRSIGKV